MSVSIRCVSVVAVALCVVVQGRAQERRRAQRQRRRLDRLLIRVSGSAQASAMPARRPRTSSSSRRCLSRLAPSIPSRRPVSLYQRNARALRRRPPRRLPEPPQPAGWTSRTRISRSWNALFMGNFHGFNTYDIENPRRPQLLASVVCPGGQGDVSVYGNLLFMSVEQTRGRVDCGVQGVDERSARSGFAASVSSISATAQPGRSPPCRRVADRIRIRWSPIRTTRRTCTSTVPAPARSAQERNSTGVRWDAGRDPNTALFSIDVIQVPLAAPEKRNREPAPHLRRSRRPGRSPGLWQGGDHGPGTQTSSAKPASATTSRCFPKCGLAAGACSGNGILLDISDPVHPVRLDQVDRQELRRSGIRRPSTTTAPR